jgi:thioredoxin reductase (NADPH)
LDAFEGSGVSYCVSCDGFFFRNKTVMVVGEGNYAANQALELKQYTPHVSICSQKKPLQMTPEFVDKLRETDITVTEEKIERLVGEETLEGVAFAGGGQAATDGLFIAMGQASAADFAMTLGLERNGEFIQADHLQHTNIPGVFAAGDCVGRFLQISVAVGEGALAARAAIRHIKSQCRQ